MNDRYFFDLTTLTETHIIFKLTYDVIFSPVISQKFDIWVLFKFSIMHLEVLETIVCIMVCII